MLTEVKKHLKFIALCVKYNLTKEMENRGAFIMQVLGMMLNNAIMILQWRILFSFTDNIGGYSYRDVIFMWAISSSTFGFSHALFYNTTQISSYITQGKLDAYLIMPKNVLVSVACSRMSVSAIGDVIYGFILLVFVSATISQYLIFILFVITGGLILTSIFTLSGCLAFFVGNSDELSPSINSATVLFSAYPEGLFEGIGKWLLFTAIPVGFSVYLPVRVIRNFSLPLMLSVVGFTAFIMALAFFIFFLGLRRYNSGNLFSSRI